MRLEVATGVELCVEVSGPQGAPAVLLINGLGSQLTAWDEGFRERLARDHLVVCFDNRDAGRSTWLDRPYPLTEMAADAVGLLDALAIEQAGLVGTSMGGMIAQLVAIEHPRRVTSLTSIMSSTGAADVGGPTPAGREILLTPPPAERQAYVDFILHVTAALGSPGAVPGPEARRAAAAEFDRGADPGCYLRQLEAMLTAGDRTAALARLRTPTLVIHGDADPLIDVSGGAATAAAIPGATLRVFPGMGHDLPARHRPAIEDAIAGHLSAAAG